MRRYIIIAKNEVTEIVIQTLLKVDAQRIYEELYHDYPFIKITLYDSLNHINEDVTNDFSTNAFCVVASKSFSGDPLISAETKKEYMNSELDAVKYMLWLERNGWKCKLYKGDKRVWSV